MPRIWVPRHVARLVVDYFAHARVRVPQHVARLVVDYFASRRLVVDYFTHVARPGASARHAARRRPLRLAQACCRLLR
jgi:hypothetical protein